MNLHTKLVLSMVKILEIYFQENGYDYDKLPEYDQSCFSKVQFDEMVDLVNSEL